MGIGFLDLFKSSLGKKEGKKKKLRGKGGAALKYFFFGSFSEEEDLRTRVRASC